MADKGKKVLAEIKKCRQGVDYNFSREENSPKEIYTILSETLKKVIQKVVSENCSYYEYTGISIDNLYLSWAHGENFSYEEKEGQTKFFYWELTAEQKKKIKEEKEKYKEEEQRRREEDEARKKADKKEYEERKKRGEVSENDNHFGVNNPKGKEIICSYCKKTINSGEDKFIGRAKMDKNGKWLEENHYHDDCLSLKNEQVNSEKKENDIKIKINKLKEEITNTTNSEKKNQLKKEIKKLESQLESKNNYSNQISSNDNKGLFIFLGITLIVFGLLIALIIKNKKKFSQK